MVWLDVLSLLCLFGTYVHICMSTGGRGAFILIFFTFFIFIQLYCYHKRCTRPLVIALGSERCSLWRDQGSLIRPLPSKAANQTDLCLICYFPVWPWKQSTDTRSNGILVSSAFTHHRGGREMEVLGNTGWGFGLPSPVKEIGWL